MKNANVNVIEVISASFKTKLTNAFKAWNKKGREKLIAGVKLGLLMNETIQKFIASNPNNAEQTQRTKAGKYLTEEIGISKTHRNLLIQIVNFDGMLKMIEDGQINSISEAKQFMSPKNQTDGNASENNEDDSNEPNGQNPNKELNRVMNILKQLDSLGINSKGISNQIIKNAKKVLDVEVTYEFNAKTA